MFEYNVHLAYADDMSKLSEWGFDMVLNDNHFPETSELKAVPSIHLDDVLTD